MKKPLLLTFIMLLLAQLGLTQSIRFAHNSYERALKQAKDTNKKIFIDTYAPWCTACKKQEKIFTDKKVAKYFNDNFINVKVNMESRVGKIIYRKYDVLFLPTLLIIDNHGNVMFRSTKIMSSEELMSIAESVNGTSSNPPTLAAAQPVSQAPASYAVNSGSSTSNSQYRSTSKTTTGPSKTGSTSARANVKSSTQTRETSSPKKPTTPSKPKYREVPISPSAKRAVSSKPPPPKKENVVKEQAGEKILHVLDGNSPNPNAGFLFQESYFRLELMDGSHVATAKKYLESQKDWSQDINMRFIMDFVYDTNTDEFRYLIINRHKFEKLLGKEAVAQNIQYLVHMKLNQGFPRPTLQEAQALLSYVNPRNSRKAAHQYYLNRLIVEEKYEEYVKMAPQYLDKVHDKDAEVMHTLALLISDKKKDKKSLDKSISLVKKATKIDDDNYDYFKTLAILYKDRGKKNDSRKAAEKAVVLARKLGIDYTETAKMLREMAGL